MHAAGESEEYGPTAEEYANGTAKPYRNRWDRFRNFDINPTVGGDIVADIYGEEADIYGEDSERATQMCPQCHGTYSPWVARCPMCLAPTPGGPLDPHAPPDMAHDARWIATELGLEGIRQINKLKRRSKRCKRLQEIFHMFVLIVEDATLNVYLLPYSMYRVYRPVFARPIYGGGIHSQAYSVYLYTGLLFGTLSLVLYLVLCGEALYDTTGTYVSRTNVRPARKHRPKFRQGHYSRDKELKASLSWLGIVVSFVAVEYLVGLVMLANNPDLYMNPEATDRAAEYARLVTMLSCLAVLGVCGAVLVVVLSACFRFLSPTIEYYPAPIRPTEWRQRRWNIERRQSRRKIGWW